MIIVYRCKSDWSKAKQIFSLKKLVTQHMQPAHEFRPFYTGDEFYSRVAQYNAAQNSRRQILEKIRKKNNQDSRYLLCQINTVTT